MQILILFYFCFNLNQVQWDEAAAIPRPERVSPWEIEPFVASAPEPPVVKNKRPRPPNDNMSLGIYFIRSSAFHINKLAYFLNLYVHRS